jgi:hypothetical protein
VAISAIDRFSDTLIFSSSSCTIKSQSWDVKAKGLVKGSFEFEALDCTLGSTN